MGLVITIGGTPGSGKSTMGRMLATRLNVPFFSAGDLFRQYATDRGMTVDEFWLAVKKDPGLWDREIDPYQASLPEKYSSFVIDSRLGFHFIKGAIKLFFQTDLRVAAERIYRNQRTEERWNSIDDGVAELQKRISHEREQYKKLYNIDHHDRKQYDFVLDTTGMNPMEQLTAVINYLRKQGYDIPK